MLRRSLAICALALIAVWAPVASLAATVQIRVEGKSQTIFGSAPPKVQAANALEALELASLAGEFYYHVTVTSFGPYVDQIGRFPAAGPSGWVFKVNGASPPVGADAVELADGDRILWYWATFDTNGAGPKTLELARGTRNGCYRVDAQDDKGVKTPARGATIAVDGRKVAAPNGRACVGPHRGLVRATLAGAVRSNALR